VGTSLAFWGVKYRYLNLSKVLKALISDYFAPSHFQYPNEPKMEVKYRYLILRTDT
jgi:hypothetical protein